MALLHSKLNSMEDVNMVNLREYLTGLSGLVKDSYGSYGKAIDLSLHCETEYLEIEKALPIGLIMVELISNSIKHAFENRDEGAISILVGQDSQTQKNVFDYKDDGKGFDFAVKNNKGLGLEIIRGLIDQLNGRVESNAQGGFELKMYF
jgi:two-component sensor histidine kinase